MAWYWWVLISVFIWLWLARLALRWEYEDGGTGLSDESAVIIFLIAPLAFCIMFYVHFLGDGLLTKNLLGESRKAKKKRLEVEAKEAEEWLDKELEKQHGS